MFAARSESDLTYPRTRARYLPNVAILLHILVSDRTCNPSGLSLRVVFAQWPSSFSMGWLNRTDKAGISWCMQSSLEQAVQLEEGHLAAVALRSKCRKLEKRVPLC